MHVWTLVFLLGGSPEPVVASSVIVSLIDDVEVTTSEAGMVWKVPIKAGDAVEAGDLLGELDPRDAELEVERVKRELRIVEEQAAHPVPVMLAEKAFGVARTELARVEELQAKHPGVVTAAELDRVQLLKDQAELEIDQAKHEARLNELRAELKRTELELALTKLQRRKVLAPLSGHVVRVDRQQGEWVPAGQTLCRIIRYDRLRAEGFVKTSSAQVKIGQTILVTYTPPDGEAVSLPGVITFVDPEVTTLTQEYRIWAEVENPNLLLRPGLQVGMTISAGP